MSVLCSCSDARNHDCEDNKPYHHCQLFLRQRFHSSAISGLSGPHSEMAGAVESNVFVRDDSTKEKRLGGEPFLQNLNDRVSELESRFDRLAKENS
ncbi:hypothetical protein FF2_022915 [Malus domestica]